jgi:DNA end-binding protein Ku
MSIRSTWTGKLMLGVVAIGIRVHTATEEVGPRGHDVHLGCGGRTGLHRYCKECEQENLESWQVGKGFEHEGEWVAFDELELKELRPRTVHEAEVIEFVEPSSIPLELYAGTLYYLSPDKPESRRSRNSTERPYTDAKSYAMFAEALRRTGKVAIVAIALRQKESLAVVDVDESGTLRMRTLLWADQIRPVDVDNLPVTDAAYTDRELAMMEMLVEAMSGKFDPAHPKYADKYSANLAAAIQERATA